MNEFKKDYTLRQAAMILNVHRDTISYWESKHLIPAPRRNSGNNYRVYNMEEIREIARIRGIYELDETAVERDKAKKMRDKSKKKEESAF